MALEGTIKDFGLPDIFQLIGLQRKTGILTLTSEKETVTVMFENGMVVMADSSAKRLEDRLGNVLVKQSKISRERLEEALQTQKATLQRLGHILVTQNYITSKDLKDALQTQVSQIVFKVFRWREGEYHFAPTDSVDFDRENFNPMSADFILMEGIRMVDEWPIIEKKIPSFDLVFRSVVDPSMIEVGAGEGEGDVLQALQESKRGGASSSNRIRLTGDEESIYRKVDGTRTVQQIIDATGASEFEVCRVLFDLLNRNIISTVGRGVSRETLSGRVETVSSPGRAYATLGVIGVVALAGLLWRFGTPFAVSGLPPLLRAPYHLILQGVAHARLERLDRAVMAYGLRHGELPRTLDALVGDGLVDRSFLKDPWARPFHFAFTDTGYLLSAVDDEGKNLPGAVIERPTALGRP
jgi:hypothetical protein